MNDLKTFNVRVPREIWIFLKRKAMDSDMSMNAIILACLDKYKRKCEKKQKESDTNEE
jgi:predicted HicB family RNase H-like nuclease